MKTLIRKDLRYYRVFLFALLAIVGVVYIIGPILAAFSIDRGRNPLIFRIADSMYAASRVGFILTPIAITLVAAISFSMERRERWSDFAAMLPVSRAKLAVAKLIVAGMICIVTLGLTTFLHHLTFYIYWYVFSAADFPYRSYPAPLSWSRDAKEIYTFVSVSLAFFGLAWLSSSLLKSPTFAFAVPFTLVLSAFFWVVILPPGTNDEKAETQIIFSIVMGSIGALGVIAGTIVQSLRVEP